METEYTSEYKKARRLYTLISIAGLLFTMFLPFLSWILIFFFAKSNIVSIAIFIVTCILMTSIILQYVKYEEEFEKQWPPGTTRHLVQRSFRS